MRIAVIGGGVSGLVCAYLLSRGHDVHLYERNSHFGGHSNTVTVSTAEEDLQLDTGFVVFNECAYPRFSRLLGELGIETQPSDMSFSVSCQACDLAYSSRGIGGALAKPSVLGRAGGLRFAFDLWRFFRQDSRSPGEHDSLNLRQYVRAKRFGSEFERHFLVPLAAAVWSTPPGGVDDLPAGFFLQFIRNHGLLGRDEGWRWRTVTGGSRSYVNALLERLDGRAFSSTPVASLRRCGEGVEVTFASGARCRFDAVVLACHADEAKELLADKSSSEEAALDCFTYTRNRAVLHADDSLLPARLPVRASWNYTVSDCHVASTPLTMTYHLNRLQALETPRDYCVSVNPPSTLRQDSIITELWYDHPAYTFRTLDGQRRIADINGRGRVFYAGAHLGYGFHEDGVASAARVAAMLGVGDA